MSKPDFRSRIALSGPEGSLLRSKRSPRPRAPKPALCLALIPCLAAAAGIARADSTITVNSGGDGNVVDTVITLREATLLGRWNPGFADGAIDKPCLTSAERNQLSGDVTGCFVVASPTLTGCTYNPLNETRYVLSNNCTGPMTGPGLGQLEVDQIQFDPSITTVSTSGDLYLFRQDDLDGTNGSPSGRVRVTASGAAAGADGIALWKFGYPGFPAHRSTVRDLEVDGFPGDCIWAPASSESIFQNLVLHGCGENGLMLSGDAFLGNPFQNVVGGGAGDGNEIRDNGQFGVRIEVNPAAGTGAALNVVEGNRIGWSFADPNGNHGNGWGGVAIVQARGNRIGSVDSGRRNRIAGNGGAGVHLYGGETAENEVIGNEIGTVLVASAWVAKPNSLGVFLEAGPHDNVVGGDLLAERNVLSGNTWQGVRITGDSDANVVRRNWIGVSPTGVGVLPNGEDGVRLEAPASGNEVLENVISGNGGHGVRIVGVGANGNRIWTNLIGPGPNGSDDFGNGVRGVSVEGGAQGNEIGASIATGNVISGNGADGVKIEGAGSDSNLVAGNTIGLSLSRASAVPNGQSGVSIAGGAKLNVVGLQTARNWISGNSHYGVYVADAGTTGNAIRGNWIGLGAGEVAIGNTLAGITVRAGVESTEISGNVVAGNLSHGIEHVGGIAAGAIFDNVVGRNATDTLSRPNQGDGIRFQDGVIFGDLHDNLIASNAGVGLRFSGGGTQSSWVHDNLIRANGGGGVSISGGGGLSLGSMSPFEPNEIVANGGFGVAVVDGSGAWIRGNRIEQSPVTVRLGAGSPPNDPFDADGGANLQINHPIVTLALTDPSATAVVWRYMGAPNATITLDFYAGACGADGRGEAGRWMASQSVTTDARGLAAGTRFITQPQPPEAAVSMTATDAAFNSSEPSFCRLLSTTTELVFADGFASGWVDAWSDWDGAAP